MFATRKLLAVLVTLIALAGCSGAAVTKEQFAERFELEYRGSSMIGAGVAPMMADMAIDDDMCANLTILRSVWEREVGSDDMALDAFFAACHVLMPDKLTDAEVNYVKRITLDQIEEDISN